MRHQPMIVVLLLIFSNACSSENDPPPVAADASSSLGEDAAVVAPNGASPSSEATAAFFRDFHAARYSRAAFHAAALDRAAEQSPTDAALALDRALAHLWHVGEAGRDPAQDLAAVARESASLPGLFQQARVLGSDPRVDCFLGTTLVSAGKALHDESLVAQGIAALDRGVAAYPEFNLFCRMLAYADYPAADPRFAVALDAAFATLDICFGEPVDRERPEIAKYLSLATDRGPKRVCWNDEIAPHNAEGFYLYFGDLLVKQGKVELAAIMYTNAKQIREYASWPYKALIEERLGSDLQARAALYADDIPSNDPPLAGGTVQRACAYCHAASADE
jgi:hypothetical protein